VSQLPPGWVWAHVGELVYLGPKNQSNDEIEAGFVPLQYLGVDYRSRHTFAVRPWSSIKKGYTHFADGDVLLARITPSFENGKAGIVRNLPNGIGAGSTEYFVCRPIPGAILPEYLLAHFKTPQFLRDGEQVMSGAVGQQRVSKQYVVNSLLPLAPLNEQKRIADKLDHILARVDACRERLDRIPVILKRFRQSVLAAATSGKLTEKWRKTTECNEEWANNSLKALCSRVSVGHVGQTFQFYTTSDIGIPFLRSQNVRPGYISLEGLTYITHEFHNQLQKSKLQAGDLLIVRVGANRGDSCVLPNMFDKVNCANIIFARPTKILPAYLSIFFQSPSCQEDLLNRTVGGAQGVINTKSVELINVKVPPVAEQTEIVRRVEELFAYADRIEARYQAARTRVDKLTPAILAKAFRGELVPQDPNDEPASVLLERIRASRAEDAVSPKPKRSLGKKIKATGKN